MAKIQYHKQEKILSIRLSNRRSVDSDIRGNVAIDYDKEGKIVNVDIMHFTLDEFSQVGNYLPKLSGILNAKVSA